MNSPKTTQTRISLGKYLSWCEDKKKKPKSMIHRQRYNLFTNHHMLLQKNLQLSLIKRKAEAINKKECTGILLRLYWYALSIVLVRSFDCGCTLLRLYWHAPSIVLNLVFECTEPFVRRKPIISLILLNCRALNVNTARARYRNGEPSLKR